MKKNQFRDRGKIRKVFVSVCGGVSECVCECVCECVSVSVCGGE